MILFLLGLLFAQDKVLIEQGKVEAAAPILAEEILMPLNLSTVVVANTEEIPDYYLQPHVGKSIIDILKEREKLICEAGTPSFLSCYSCQQENDKFLFTFEFGKKPGASECILIRYAVKFKADANQEHTTIGFLQKMKFAVDPKTFATPMVFEKPPVQVNVKLQDKFLWIDFLEPEMQALRSDYDSKFSFLSEEIRVLWPQYIFLTEQYLKEVGVKQSDILNTKKAADIGELKAFLSRWGALTLEMSKISSREDRACHIFQNRDVLSYPVTTEAKTQTKANVKKHWSEFFNKDLKDTVCGNFYYLERMKSYFSNVASCDGFSANDEIKGLEAFLKNNISVLERQLATLFLTTLQIKMAYNDAALSEDKKKAEIFKSLDRLDAAQEAYKSYVNFKKSQWSIFRPEMDFYKCSF
jgi:hypothetical protein